MKKRIGRMDMEESLEQAIESPIVCCIGQVAGKTSTMLVVEAIRVPAIRSRRSFVIKVLALSRTGRRIVSFAEYGMVPLVVPVRIRGASGNLKEYHIPLYFPIYCSKNVIIRI